MSDEEFEKDLEQRFPQFSMGLRDAMTRIPQSCDDCTSSSSRSYLSPLFFNSA
jgi:hypothetical protein